MRIFFYMSAIVFKMSMLPEKAQAVLRYNPAIYIVDGFRDILMYNKWPQWEGLAATALFSLVGIAFGVALIRRFDPLYAKRIAR
jgi:lipopolysaccharide transport system permease protein